MINNNIKQPPVMKLSVEKIENSLMPNLEIYHSIYASLFQRVEQKEQVQKYMQNLLGKAPNKAVETMVLAAEDPNEGAIRAQQRFVSNSPWNDQAILSRHWLEVNKELGEEEGVLIADGSDFAKQGDQSVGVKRQWCGELGKKANCQAGVFLGYASARGYTLLDRRLYLPQEWVKGDEFAQKRKKCGIPEDVSFKTKPTLAADMILSLARSKALRFRWLTCDEAFGRDTAFLDSVAATVNYFAEVPLDTHVWLTRPQTAIPQWQGRGRKPTRERLVPGEPVAQTGQALAASLSPENWSLHQVKEGSKGPIIAEFAALRVVAVRDRLPGPAVWLVFRRDPQTKELKAFLSNAPQTTPLSTFLWLSGMRWPIESSFEEAKQEIGLGDYQVRGWRGWHHHMTMCILAHFFLVRLQLQLGADAPALTLPQTIQLLQAVLPKPDFEVQHALRVVEYLQKRHYAAYLSHRKKRLRPLIPNLSL